MAKMQEELVRALRYCYQEGIIFGQTGCISLRFRGSRFLITPKGATYNEITEHHIGTYDWNRKKWSGPGLPPIEVRTHRELYKDHAETNAIIQSQPLFSTIAACQELKIDKNITALTAATLGNIMVIPYQHQGSDELHNAIKERVINSDILLISNYGVIVTGRSLKEAIDKTINFEFLCRIHFYGQAANLKLVSLPEATVESIRDYNKKNQSVFQV